MERSGISVRQYGWGILIRSYGHSIYNSFCSNGRRLNVELTTKNEQVPFERDKQYQYSNDKFSLFETILEWSSKCRTLHHARRIAVRWYALPFKIPIRQAYRRNTPSSRR